MHYTPLHYIQLHYNSTKLHYATLHYTQLHYATLHLQVQPQPQLQHYTTLHYTTLQIHYITLGPLHLQYTCKCTTLTTVHHNYNSTTLQLQLQLHYTTLLPAVVCEVTDQVTTATIVTTPKSKIPTTFQSISGFALPSVIHNHQPLL